MNKRPLSWSRVSDANDRNVGVTGLTQHSSYEAAGAPRCGVDMVAYGFAVLVKANGKPTDDTGG